LSKADKVRLETSRSPSWRESVFEMQAVSEVEEVEMMALSLRERD